MLQAISFNAIAQERLPCEWGHIDVSNPACERPLVILKQYRNASTYAEHQSLLNDVIQSRNEDFQRRIAAKKEIDLYDPFIDDALMIWLDWYQVAFTARAENRQLLDSETWRKYIQLAHRDPYVAIAQLNKLRVFADDNEHALSLLLIGVLTNQLNTLAEAANHASFPVKSNDDDYQKRAQRFDTYVEQHKQDFYVGETCYGGNYTGRHFAAVKKRYPQSNYAQAAAYLAMRITPCGECEGDFACYLSKGLDPTSEFLQAYPQSTYVTMLLKRAHNRIRGEFIAREAQGDYLSKSDPKTGDYSPQGVANVLIAYEGSLKQIAPPELIATKLLLADLYIKLNQRGNAKRVIDWLSEHAPGSAELNGLRQALASDQNPKRLENTKQVAEKKKKLLQAYRLQACELDKAWLGQEGIACRYARLKALE
ncbi:hypothetical protein [Undibacterium sp.]|uniref:hypothetical protein n=1 Tax=Undibacterium sp. TaxID=1914977 RepID=UPI003750C6FD